jgi:outer membrane protein assembly factor BamB
MTTEDFIDLLLRQQLVSSGIARQLQDKAAKGDSRITPKSILKYLVKKEIVSRTAAKRLLETTIIVSDKAESSILGLAPLVDVDSKTTARATAPSAEPAPASAPLKPVTKASASPPPLDDDLFAVSPLSAGAAPYFDEAEALEPLEGEKEEVGEAAQSAPGSRLRERSKKKKGDKAAKRLVRKTRGKSEWDSPLLLLGGGSLAVLVVGRLVLWWLVFRESADAALKKANDSFDQGHYQVAIEQYKAFIDKYPRDQESSEAKVRMGLSRLWEAAEGRNYAGASDMAPTVIGEIENEPAFIADADDPDGLSRAKKELSELLTKVAQGLAEQAESAKDNETANKRIEQINVILKLSTNNKYVPPKFRLDTQLDSVRETLTRVELREQREADLAKALESMDEAIKRGEPAAALAVRASLLKNHPVLVDDESLDKKVLEISAAEKAAIKFVEAHQAAATDAPQGPVVAELALADRRGQSTAGGPSGSLAVQIDGAVYSLNLADGALLWRRSVGLDATATPLTLPDGKVVAADAQRGELVCLEGDTGKLAWRQPLEGKLASPVATGERLLVASESGKLYVIDQTTGALIGYVPFSQPLRTSPTINEPGDRIFVLGEHSNLYTLSSADFSCLGVHYLGHAIGAISVPPVVVLNKIIVADNSGAETSQVRVFVLDEKNIVTGEVSSHRLSGLVTTPLQVAGRRFAAVTTLGQAAVFEAGAGNDKAAVALLASRDATGKEQLSHFALVHEGHLWIAGNQLMKLAILPTGNQLPVRSIDRDFQGDVFDFPVLAAGHALVHVRRPAKQAGAIVSAMDVAKGTLWETALAVPPAGPPAVDASGLRLTAGAASGAVYRLDREAMTRRVQDKAERPDVVSNDVPTMTDSLDLGQGRLVLGGVEAKHLLHFRPDDPRQPLKAIELAGPLSCPPVSWRDGFVVATEVGQAALLNADDASGMATPFQPDLVPGRKYHWLRPAVAGEGAQSLLAISDGIAKVYLISLQSQPQPHLKAVASVDIGPSRLVTPLAAASSRIFAGNEKGELVSFTLPGLEANDPVDIGGRAAWGPFRAGDGLLVANERKELMMVGADGSIRWRQPVKHGELGGAPLVDGQSAFLLYPEGAIVRVNLADGTEAGLAELDQPAVAGPVVFGPRLVVSAHDGTLLVVNRP